MTPGYRALCVELLAAIQLYTQLNPAASDMSPFELTEKLMDAMAATVAALAQPEVAWEPMLLPGDAEGLAEVFWAEPEAEGPSKEELREMLNENDWNYISSETFEDIARTVLAQWGRPTPQPVAVSERLPGPEDCDGEGRYWGLVLGCEAWALAKGNPRLLCITHWLPAHALPTLEANV